MLVVSRFAVPEEQSGEFAGTARAALEAFAGRPGFRRGRVGRAVDDPEAWVLVSEWDGVGAYRRALSSYDVRVSATPLLAEARDEPGAFEVLVAVEGAGAAVTTASARASDADISAPRRHGSDSAPNEPTGIRPPGRRIGAGEPRPLEDR